MSISWGPKQVSALESEVRLKNIFNLTKVFICLKNTKNSVHNKNNVVFAH